MSRVSKRKTEYSQEEHYHPEAEFLRPFSAGDRRFEIRPLRLA